MFYLISPAINGVFVSPTEADLYSVAWEYKWYTMIELVPFNIARQYSNLIEIRVGIMFHVRSHVQVMVMVL